MQYGKGKTYRTKRYLRNGQRDYISGGTAWGMGSELINSLMPADENLGMVEGRGVAGEASVNKLADSALNMALPGAGTALTLARNLTGKLTDKVKCVPNPNAPGGKECYDVEGARNPFNIGETLGHGKEALGDLLQGDIKGFAKGVGNLATFGIFDETGQKAFENAQREKRLRDLQGFEEERQTAANIQQQKQLDAMASRSRFGNNFQFVKKGGTLKGIPKKKDYLNKRYI